MSRANYIYLIRDNDKVVSAHSVKYEAHIWAHRNWTAGMKLSSIRDGRYSLKAETPLEWDWATIGEAPPSQTEFYNTKLGEPF